jgi:hypothetical protein
MDCRMRGCIGPSDRNERNAAMSITIKRPIEVVPGIMHVHLKVRDEFSFKLMDTNGHTIAEQEDGYVPGFFPGDYGDYVDLQIDVRTGQIVNWDDHFSMSRLQKFIDEKENEDR